VTIINQLESHLQKTYNPLKHDSLIYPGAHSSNFNDCLFLLKTKNRHSADKQIS